MSTTTVFIIAIFIAGMIVGMITSQIYTINNIKSRIKSEIHLWKMGGNTEEVIYGLKQALYIIEDYRAKNKDNGPYYCDSCKYYCETQPKYGFHAIRCSCKETCIDGNKWEKRWSNEN